MTAEGSQPRIDAEQILMDTMGDPFRAHDRRRHITLSTRRWFAALAACATLLSGFVSASAGELVYLESFAGPDGSSWPAPWVQGSSHVTVHDLQGRPRAADRRSGVRGAHAAAGIHHRRPARHAAIVIAN